MSVDRVSRAPDLEGHKFLDSKYDRDENDSIRVGCDDELRKGKKRYKTTNLKLKQK